MIVTKVSKSTAVLLANNLRVAVKDVGHSSFPECKSKKLAERARYIVVTVDTRLTWSAYVNQVGMMAAQILDVLVPTLTRYLACPLEMECCSTDYSSVL
jgi:hypothetical protein